jgi:hypothetical protein
MKNQKYSLILFCLLVVVYFPATVLGQSGDDRNKIATVSGRGSSARWEMAASHSGAILTIAAPDGRTFTRAFKAGVIPEFNITDRLGGRLPDGVYTYELRLGGAGSLSKDALNQGRSRDDEPEAERAARKSSAALTQVQSGSFAILNGSIIVAGAMEEGPRAAAVAESTLRRPVATSTMNRISYNHPSMLPLPDQVIADDLIVQGSVCAGLDCVVNENFGFDTIRLKENNDRIQFDDTSVSAGFATNNWQIRANNSASGGASFLAFVDQGATGNSETGTIVFEVDAGAPANSLKVASTGRVGLRTATPVLDLHFNTSDTPATRFEQNNSGGFTAQTWDVAGNEANFFVRDVTSGSRLPFRIRPGAPTSSIDIAASGNVGIGFQSPELRLDTRVANSTTDFGNNLTYAAAFGNLSGKRVVIGYDETVEDVGVIQSVHTGVGFKNLSLNPNSGNVGIGTVTPDQRFSVNGDASKAGGGAWQVFSDERLKSFRGKFTSGLKAVMQLQPVRYEYRADNALGIKSEGEHIGFGAQAVQKIIPEAVTKNSQGYLMVNNDPIIWTMLNAIKEQQKEIADLKAQVRRLSQTRHHRRR